VSAAGQMCRVPLLAIAGYRLAVPRPKMGGLGMINGQRSPAKCGWRWHLITVHISKGLLASALVGRRSQPHLLSVALPVRVPVKNAESGGNDLMPYGGANLPIEHSEHPNSGGGSRRGYSTP
jgi:hypothetical protein